MRSPSERMQASTLLFATSRPTNRVFCGILHSLPCSCGLSRPCNCSGLRKTPDLSLAPFTGFRLGGSRAQIRRRAVAPAAARSPNLPHSRDTRAVAVTALEIVAVHAVVGLDVADGRLGRGASFHRTFDRCGGSPDLA